MFATKINNLNVIFIFFVSLLEKISVLMLTFNNLSGLIKFNILEKHPEVLNFVTTRQTPSGSGTMFNIGYSGGSDQDTLDCRKELAQSLGLKAENFVFQQQVHKDNVKIVTQEDCGKGFLSRDTAIKATDILVTKERNICLVTRSADCVPVLLYSPDSKSAAAIHSGREGTYLGVAAKAAKTLAENFGAKIENMIACIGPAIGFECYEVDTDCAEKFTNNPRFSHETYAYKNGKVFLDLKSMIYNDLITLGLKPENIEKSDICTKCSNNRFFSARMKDNQRFCAGIMIKNQR